MFRDRITRKAPFVNPTSVSPTREREDRVGLLPVSAVLTCANLALSLARQANELTKTRSSSRRRRRILGKPAVPKRRDVLSVPFVPEIGQFGDDFRTGLR